jgi:cyclophilin family peptidyl-prolyl cis-trans isomerase
MDKKKLIFFSIMSIGLIFFNSTAQDSRRNMIIIETDLGKMKIELELKKAPLHSENFLKLAGEGFFDGTTFHRVVPGFVIQGGDPLSKDSDPTNDGTGGPGYTIPAEIGLPHLRGSIGAARKGDQVNPNRESNGSQFYICLEPQPYLDKMGYTIFAKVVDGMEVADKIAAQPVNGQAPLKPVVMKRVYVEEQKQKKP